MNKVKIKKDLLGLGLREELIPVWSSFVNEKCQMEAIAIFKNLNISRERIDTKNECNILIRYRKKGYDVSVEVVENEMRSYCTCEHHVEAGGCSHAGAVMLWKMIKDEKNDFNSKPKTLLRKREVDGKNKGGLGYFKELFPVVKKIGKKNILYFNFEGFGKSRQALLLQRGVIKNDGSNSLPMKFTGNDFDYSKLNVSRRVRQVLNFLVTRENFNVGSSRDGLQKTDFYDVTSDLMMPILRDIYFDEQELILGATFSKKNFHIKWESKINDEGNYVLTPYFVSGRRKVNLLRMKVTELGLNSLWLFDSKERCFYEHKKVENIEAVKNIIRFPKELTLNEKELKKFFNKYYQQMLNSFEFDVSGDFKREERSIIPKARIYLERDGVKVRINLRFDYGGREIGNFSSAKDLIIVDKDIIYEVPRDLEEEDRMLEFLNSHNIVRHEKFDEFKVKGDLVDFVIYDIPGINEADIDIRGEEGLFNFKVNKAKGSMMMEVQSDVDWFDLKGEVSFGRDKVKLEKVLERIFQNKRFVDLGNGKKGVIPKDWVNDLRAYRGFFNMDKGKVKLSKYHMPVLESLINLSKKSKLDTGAKKISDRFRNFERISEVKVPKGLKADLRDYQKAGYDWLNFLREYEFNGILADDMGLGKTVQALALLEKVRTERKGKAKFLIVVPTSLVGNWKAEIEKFTPGIKTYSHHGSGRVKGEKEFLSMLGKNDLVITTYGVLKNDLANFTKMEFDYIVLDEAHVIKNPISVSARTVSSLRGKRKLVISGTPIQNNLMELWSLFEFLSPGYLGSYDSFKENFVLKIEKGKDGHVVNNLKKMIDPFLLWRNKSTIASELPEKTEMVLNSSFGEEESLVYQTWKDHFSSEINRSIKDKGMNKSRLKILQGLTKLRQVSLHPKMVDEKYTGSSAKFDLLMTQVEKVLSEGHKVLIFSSFVKMLTIVREEFARKGIKYSYLDGTSKNREDIVSEFQDSKDARPFLISIKAGGVGLNLTSADYVFILDPWWNPAVEMQAMDRAHRIGQDKPVFVYKMIAEGSIEEKILELQKSKKKLVEDVISVEKGISKNMDAEMVREIFG